LQGEVELGSGGCKTQPSFIWIKAIGMIGVSNFDPRAALPFANGLMTLMRPLFAETFDDSLSYVWGSVFGIAGADLDQLKASEWIIDR
jgi:hypothetical protein